MQLTKGEVYDAGIGLAQIIQRPREIPTMGKYRIARMHDILAPIGMSIEQERMDIIQRLGHERFEDEEKTKSKGWGVDPGTPAYDQYLKDWNELRAQPIEVSVTPMALKMLGNSESGVEANEFKLLGQLVVDTEEVKEPKPGEMYHPLG